MTSSKSAKHEATTNRTEPRVYCTEACQTTLPGRKHHQRMPRSRRYDVFVHGLYPEHASGAASLRTPAREAFADLVQIGHSGPGCVSAPASRPANRAFTGARWCRVGSEWRTVLSRNGDDRGQHGLAHGLPAHVANLAIVRGANLLAVAEHVSVHGARAAAGRATACQSPERQARPARRFAALLHAAGPGPRASSGVRP